MPRCTKKDTEFADKPIYGCIKDRGHLARCTLRPSAQAIYDGTLGDERIPPRIKEAEVKVKEIKLQQEEFIAAITELFTALGMKPNIVSEGLLFVSPINNNAVILTPLGVVKSASYKAG